MPFTRIVLALLAAALAGAAFAQPAPPEYTLKQSEPSTGSNIRATVVRGHSIPLDKRYDEFTPEQKAILNANYETMGPGDEPPFPAEGLGPVYSAISQGQRKLGTLGDLVLYATVGADGNVTEVKAIASPDPKMTRFASTVLLLTKFKPALCKGVPCRMDYPLRIKFTRQL